MSSEFKEIIEEKKDERRTKRYPMPISFEKQLTLGKMQEKYLKKYGEKISLADLAGKIFDTVDLRKYQV